MAYGQSTEKSAAREGNKNQYTLSPVEKKGQQEKLKYTRAGKIVQRLKCLSDLPSVWEVIPEQGARNKPGEL